MTKRTPSSLRSDPTSSTRDFPILISACLLGVRCRYDGGERGCPDLVQFASSAHVIPFCPEQLGGLSTPRPASNIVGGDGQDVLSGKAKLVNTRGEEVTGAFLRGARESLKLARLTGAKRVILKDKSPSCGLKTPYCESPTGSGPGVTAACFIMNGLTVMDINPEADFPPPDFLKFLGY